MSWLQKLFSRKEDGISPFTTLAVHYHDGDKIPKAKNQIPKGFHQMKLKPHHEKGILERWNQYWEDVGHDVTAAFVHYKGVEGDFFLLVGTGPSTLQVQDCLLTLVDPKYERPMPKLDLGKPVSNLQFMLENPIEVEGKKYRLVPMEEE